MSEEVARLDLRARDVAPGAAERIRLRVPAVELRLGGEDYTTDPASPEVDVEVSRSLSGLHLRLRVDVALQGPCWCCTEPARIPLAIDVSEFAADGRPDDAPFDEDFDSVYLEDGVLDLGLWVRDSIAEAVPPLILCREDCAGLCPICGVDRNTTACDCAVDTTDPRWDALRALSERLRPPD